MQGGNHPLGAKDHIPWAPRSRRSQLIVSFPSLVVQHRTTGDLPGGSLGGDQVPSMIIGRCRGSRL
jgi:hypothetical protein